MELSWGVTTLACGPIGARFPRGIGGVLQNNQDLNAGVLAFRIFKFNGLMTISVTSEALNIYTPELSIQQGYANFYKCFESL